MILRSFEELECWQAGRELRVFIARQVLPQLPAVERHRLGDQVLRAARSVTANIAEGFGRVHYLDNSKFCRNALGSCCEVLDHLITATDEEMLPRDLMVTGRQKIEATQRLINGYITYLRRAGNA